MGLYDFRCAITGISLKGVDAVLVGLQPAAGGLRPITLGITGTYNRAGSIDNIREGLHTDLVFAYFRERAETGQFVLDPGYKRDYGNPPRDIESLLRYWERNVTDSTDEHPAATLSGQRIFSVLVAEPVWSALAAAFAPRDGTVETWFKRVFGDSVAQDIYGSRIPDLAARLREMSAVDDFLAGRGIGWQLPDPAEIGAQHDAPELRDYLDAAHSTFHDVPAVRAALGDYATQVRDLLDEDEDEDQDQDEDEDEDRDQDQDLPT